MAERVVLLTTYVVLFAAGVVLGAINTFLVPEYVDGVAGIAIVIAVVGNATLGVLGGYGTRRMAGAASPALGWLIAVGIFTVVARGGDVVLAGKLPTDPTVVHVSTAYVFAGFLASVGSIALCSWRFARPVAARRDDASGSSGAGTTPSG